MRTCARRGLRPIIVLVAALLTAIGAPGPARAGTALAPLLPGLGGTPPASEPYDAPASPPATPLAPLPWHGDMEEGSLADFFLPNPESVSWHGGGEFNSGGGDSTASTDMAHTGRWAAKLVLSDGSGGTRLFRWQELRFYRETTQSVWLYIPRAYVEGGKYPWWNVVQIMSRSTTNEVRPIWYLDAQNTPTGGLRLDLVWWHRTLGGPRQGQVGYKRFRQSVTEVPIGRWFQLTTQLRQSRDFDGTLRVWQDDALLFDMQDVRTSFENCAYNAWCASNEWSVNNYSDDLRPAPAVIYADDAHVARLVEPNLRLSAPSQTGKRRFTTRVSVRDGAIGSVRLRLRYCRRPTAAACTTVLPVPRRQRRRGSNTTFTFTLPRTGRWEVGASFRGRDGWRLVARPRSSYSSVREPPGPGLRRRATEWPRRSAVWRTAEDPATKCHDA